MLSIIISSYQPDYFTALEKNIAETCGVPYEIVKVDNPGLMGICEAYNKGAEKARFENLLFLHEDVKFHSKNWGATILDYYKIKNLGVLGLAGSIRKFQLPYGHYSCLKNENYRNVYHSLSDPYIVINNSKPKLKVVDGVFLGMKKEVWKSLRFNEKIKGYHLYDIDISLRASENYDNYLVEDILFEHFSKGNFGDEWVKASVRFNRLKGYQYNVISRREKKDLRNFWYKRLKTENISFFNRLSYALALGTDRNTLVNWLSFILNR